MVWTNLYMEEAMLIIFLGTSMKSHSAAPMAAAAAGWLQGYRVRRPLMTIIACKR